MQAYVGGLIAFFLTGMGVDAVSGTIPESVFMMFQMTFAIITPALICGAFADRMKFSAMMWFMGLWSIFVYSPIAHWVWGGGFLGTLGVLDFAGGTVVHINAGVAGLVCALVLGKRIGLGTENMAPHNLVLSVIGASLLWVGWFGFNAGSELASDGRAGMAMAVTQIATAAAALAWMFVEWIVRGQAQRSRHHLRRRRRPGRDHAGLRLGRPDGRARHRHRRRHHLRLGGMWLKAMLGYDDSLDAFGVHGVGGFVGAILTGVFAVAAVGGEGHSGLIDGNPGQVWTQFDGTIATIVWSGVVELHHPEDHRHGHRPPGHQGSRSRRPRHQPPRRSHSVAD